MAPPAAALRIASAGRASIQQADELAGIFKMLGNTNRLRILMFLDSVERTVSEIEATLKIRQPTLSQQLGELRDAGLITGRRVAKAAIYSLTADRGRRALAAIFANRPSEPGAHPGGAPPRPCSAQPAAMFASLIPLRRNAAGESSAELKYLAKE